MDHCAPGPVDPWAARGRYRAALPDVRPPPFARISRADVAGFMLREVVERRFLYAAVELWDEP